MTPQDAEDFIKKLFSCAHTRPPGAHVQFMMSPPVTREAARFGTDYWLDDDTVYDLAAELMGKIGSIQTEERLSEIAHRLSQFITYNFRSEWMFRRNQVNNYGELLDAAYTSTIVVDFLEKFTVHASRFLLATPIKNISVSEPIVSEQIHIASPLSFESYPISSEWGLTEFNARLFPSDAFDSFRRQNVTEHDLWIVVKGATRNSVRSMLYSCLGALWATLDARDCVFSGADPFIGEEIHERNGRANFRSGPEFLSVPIDPVSLNSQRTALLRRLLLHDGGFVGLNKRRIACEFAYYLWRGEGTVAFSNAVIGLDALFGGERSNTARIASGAAHVLADESQTERISEIIRFRNAVLHGGVASVLQSSKYRKYVRKFKSEPEIDTASILRNCLRQSCDEHPNYVFVEPTKTRWEIFKTFLQYMRDPAWRPN